MQITEGYPLLRPLSSPGQRVVFLKAVSRWIY